MIVRASAERGWFVDLISWLPAFRRAPLIISLCWLGPGCADTYHKGYGGPELPDEALSFVHAASPPTGFFSELHTSLINPQSGKMIPSGGSVDQGSQWLVVKPPTACITVRTEAFNCVNPFGGQCVPNAHTQRDHELCFAVDAGGRYDVQTQARGNRDCYAGFEVTGYRVVDLTSEETVSFTEVIRHCWNYVGHRISEWARLFPWRNGNWMQRSMWSSVDSEIRKRWSRSLEYRDWWSENGRFFDAEFIEYVESEALEGQR